MIDSRSARRALVPLLAMYLVGPGLARQDPIELEVIEIASPAGEISRWPGLVRSDGTVLLSWLEVADDGADTLRWSRFDGEAWSDAQTIASGTEWFVNWADCPTLAANGEGLLATWLERNGEPTYAYGVRFACSRDAGKTWGAQGTLHTDRSPSEHGFVSLTSLAEGAFAAVWLDGRNTSGDHGRGGPMALYTNVVGADGKVSAEAPLDDRVCDCCPTDSVLLEDGMLVVAYRDRSEDEVRDVYVVRGRPGDPDSWSEPQPVHRDGWSIAGCPVNGPALAVRGEQVVLGWFTMGTDLEPRVQVAFSDDGGRSFGAPMRIDEGRPHGRVDVTVLAAGTVVVTWLEGADEGADWKARMITPKGVLGPSVTAARAAGDRSDGHLRTAPHGEGALLAWTDAADVRVRVARLGAK